jgi:hypothetical protein
MLSGRTRPAGARTSHPEQGAGQSKPKALLTSCERGFPSAASGIAGLFASTAIAAGPWEDAGEYRFRGLAEVADPVAAKVERGQPASSTEASIGISIISSTICRDARLLDRFVPIGAS